MQNIAIFASGEGTNAENIIRFFENSDDVNIAAVIVNRTNAGVLKRAEKYGIPTEIINRAILEDAEQMLPILEKYNTDFIVLAGFLALIPPYLVERFPKGIVNIHPSLIPLHCGKGMYGMKVHEDVVKSGDKESGITVHFVDENYDHGQIILQQRCTVTASDTPEDVAHHVHELEYAYFPKAIEMALKIKNEQ